MITLVEVSVSLTVFDRGSRGIREWWDLPGWGRGWCLTFDMNGLVIDTYDINNQQDIDSKAA
jgi:hypothetical protein